MRITFSVVAVAFLLVVGAIRVDARPRSAADTAKLEKLLGHADKMSAILEKDLEQPKKALKNLDRYLKKNRKKMKKLIGQLAAAAGELDKEARETLMQDLAMDDRTARLLKALSTFKDRHESDPELAPRIEARMKELMEEGGRLYEALTQE
jgi:septal ring factor EnvC (AmiA/AmiB activator)